MLFKIRNNLYIVLYMIVVLYLHLYHIKFLLLFVIGISVKSVIKWVGNVDKTLR